MSGNSRQQQEPAEATLTRASPAQGAVGILVLQGGEDVKSLDLKALAKQMDQILADKGETDLVGFWLHNDIGASVDSRDAKGATLLHYAAAECSTELVDWLLDHGCQVNARDESHATALEWAAVRDRVDVCQRMVWGDHDRFGDIDYKNVNDHGRTIADRARQAKAKKAATFLNEEARLLVVQALNAADHRLGLRDENGWTALHHLAKKRDWKNVTELVDIHSANPYARDSNNESPLWIAVRDGDLEGYEWYEKRGFPLRAYNGQDRNLMHAALLGDEIQESHFNPEIIRRLALHCENEEVNLIDEEDVHGWAPLHLAALLPLNQSVEAVRLLLELHADPLPHRQGSGKPDQTPFRFALVSGNAEAAEMLLDASTKYSDVWADGDEWEENIYCAINCHADGVMEKLLALSQKHEDLASAFSYAASDAVRRARAALISNDIADAGQRAKRIVDLLEEKYPEAIPQADAASLEADAGA